MAATLFLAACSSATVVSSEDRVTEQRSDANGAGANDAPDAEASEGDSQDSTDTSDDDASDSDATNSDASDSDVADNDPSDSDASDSDASDDDERPQTPQQLEESEGFGLGGAEQLDGLRADCEDGSNLACDVLFQLSDFDTEEEAVALSCGGRSDTATLFCTEGIDAATEEFFFDPDSSGVSDIVDQCVEFADMTACDFLFFRSPIGSDLEALGGTCGGRVEVAVPDCRTFLRTAE